MILRPFQERALAATRELIRCGKRAPLIVCPTGGGKTCMGSAIAHRHIERGGDRRVVWFAHRRELVEQAARTLQNFGLPVGYNGLNAAAPVQVESVQSALSRGQAPAGTLAIFDEAHHFVADEWKALPDLYAHALRIGLTATPERQDGRGLSLLFDAVHVAAQVSELIALGHLVRCGREDIFAPKGGALDNELAMEPVDAYLRYAPGSSAVVFARSVKACREHADAFLAKGVAAEVITGNMDPDRRESALEKFARGSVQVLVNVYVLTEGWDCPRAKTCILASKVGSAGGYLQRGGRVLRPYPGATHATLIDLLGSNVDEYGALDEDRVFELEGLGIRRKQENVDAFCRVHQIPRDQYGVCPECGSRDSRAVGALGIAGVELDRWAGKRAADDTVDKRAVQFAAFLRTARAKGHKEAAAKVRFRAIYRHWPSSAIVNAAERILSAEKGAR